MAFEHQLYLPSARVEMNLSTNQIRYKAQVGQENTFNGSLWLPYWWKGASNELQYGHGPNNIEYVADRQILKAAGKVLTDSFKFFVQAEIGAGNWVNQPHGIPNRNIVDDYPTEGRATGYLNFPDAHLSFGAQDPYDLQIGLEVGKSEKATLGFRFRAPVSGNVRFQAVLDNVQNLPTDWEWIWATFDPSKGKEDRKIGIRVKDFEWRWDYEEAPFRDISVTTNPDDTLKVTIEFGPYDYTTPNEWLTVYPDTWGETGIANTNDDCYEYGPGTVDLDGYDSDGLAVGLFSSNDCDGSFRFQNVVIAANPTSVDVGTQIEYDCPYSGNAGFWDFRVFGLEGDTPAFNSADPSSRTRTAAYIDMSCPSTGNNKVVSGANFRALIKEILDTGWVSGYDLGITFDNNGAGSGDQMQVEDYSTTGGGTAAARITIVYTPAAGVSIPVMWHHYSKNIGSN